MKIIKFRVKNYKSINDSGDCFFTDNITIFAGRNESGKTSLLEALEDFDADKEIRKEAKPINNPDSLPEIIMTFEIDKETLDKIFKEIGLKRKASESTTLEIIKQFPDLYHISVKSLKKLNITAKFNIATALKVRLAKFEKLYDKRTQIAGEFPVSRFDDLEDFKASITKFETLIIANLASIPTEKERNEISNLIKSVKDDIAKLEDVNTLELEFLNVLKTKWIPYFILFNSFEDIFPNKIPFAELATNEWVKDLTVISDLDIETIKGTSDRTKEKHRDDVNIKLNKDYEKFWKQDISSLSVNWDSNFLYFWIKQDGYPYEPSIRSKGRQWHLAFYIKVTARAKEDVPNIILIDEPGLFLHAKAQKDILEKLEDSAKTVQLIFSTHSPYLLESEKLNRIRLICRTPKDGTKVENKVHALADKDTLTPILTAIGLDLNSSIANIDKINNIVVEGQSDLFYLEGFKKILKNNDLKFIFGGGAGNMPFVGTILLMWAYAFLATVFAIISWFFGH